MILGHRIRLVPTHAQELYFRQACGVARFAYNWGLAEWQRCLAAGERTSETAIRRKLNSLKDVEFPWMRDVGKCAPQHAIRNLGRAYANYFVDIRKAGGRKGANPPRFKRKGIHDAFRADNGLEKRRFHAVKTRGKRIKIPRAGWVKMREAVRFSGRIVSVTISRRADRWYASVAVEITHDVPDRIDARIAGCDLGITTFATIADEAGCWKAKAPKPLARLFPRLKRLHRACARKVLSSRNQAKAKIKLGRLYARIADIRNDALHRLSTRLVREYRTICIEDLNPSGIMSNRYLARAVSDLGLGEFRRQLSYKASMYGARLVIADRWFPSSKICSSCASINSTLAFGQSAWGCPICAAQHDRDENAAINLRIAASSAVTACGAEGSGPAGSGRTKPAALKQEDLTRSRLIIGFATE